MDTITAKKKLALRWRPAAWTVRLFGPWQWHVHPQWIEALLSCDTEAFGDETLRPVGLRWAEWERACRLFVVKSAKHRTVWRIELPQGHLFVKFYPVADWRARLRQCFRPPKARTEAMTAWRLQNLGIRTVTPIAFGETADGASCLVTLGLRQPVTVREFLEGPLANRMTAPERHRLTLELADLIGTLHGHGVLHDDLHAGNLLLAEGVDGLCHPHVIDLHAVRFVRRLSHRQAWSNLVMLNRWFIQRSHRTDRLRFWRRYVAVCSRSGFAPKDARETAKQLETATWQSCLRFWRNRDRRCVSQNAYFRRVRHGPCVGYAVRDLPEELIRELASDPDRPFVQGQNLLKASKSSAVAVICRHVHGQARRFVWKRFSVTRWSDPWVHLVRPTPALRSWINGHRLRECGLPTPRPLLVLHRRRFGLIQESYLLAEFVEGARSLRQSWESTPSHEARQRLLADTARLIGEMHRRGLSHRDLKAANILADSQGRLFLIDLVGMERLRKVDRRRKVQNLARLHTSFCLDAGLSLSDRLRFLRTYLHGGMVFFREWKAWWREIASATEKKIEQNRRRGRPLS
ncbi:MAG: hypothetical protein NZM31_12735 [Gemmatales bacterium]|nr:hypothetical protein [Gemmatales bacterium]MDW8387861.1 lipopolysaccharide kinase InaA family protein [Gemmatales bacterium]